MGADNSTVPLETVAEDADDDDDFDNDSLVGSVLDNPLSPRRHLRMEISSTQAPLCEGHLLKRGYVFIPFLAHCNLLLESGFNRICQVQECPFMEAPLLQLN